MQAIQSFKGWSLVDGKLVKEFQFANFPTAIVFVSQLVNPSEELDLYPEILIRYNRVQLRLFTPITGGVTMKDIEYVRQAESFV